MRRFALHAGGSNYIQNAAPDGPASWVASMIAERVGRRHTQTNCLYRHRPDNFTPENPLQRLLRLCSALLTQWQMVCTDGEVERKRGRLAAVRRGPRLDRVPAGLRPGLR